METIHLILIITCKEKDKRNFMAWTAGLQNLHFSAKIEQDDVGLTHVYSDTGCWYSRRYVDRNVLNSQSYCYNIQHVWIEIKCNWFKNLYIFSQCKSIEVKEKKTVKIQITLQGLIWLHLNQPLYSGKMPE